MQIKKNQISNRIKISCRNCGKEFGVPNCRRDIANFCSRECCDKYKEEKKLYPYNRPPVLIFCQICKKEFKVRPYRRNAKYCSKECFNKSQRGKISFRKGLTYEEEFGIEKSEEIKEKISKNILGKRLGMILGLN